MANFSALKTAIQNAIKQNGNEEITGDVLQQILLSIVSTMGDGAINTIEQNLSNETTTRQGADTQLQNAINAIKANIDNGYVYAGIATPSSTPVSGKVFYVATAAGTYTNFGGQVLTQGINILRYNGSAWSSQQLIGIDDLPSAGSNNLVKSGGVQNELALGAVYDVSAKNPTAGPNNDGKWESLSALLSDADLNTLIPTAYRKGGMSIKFVHSSDNKYVQYRLMSDSFNTTVANWQGVDDEPTPGSDNLVNSGGVSNILANIDIKSTENYGDHNYWESDGTIDGDSRYRCTKIDVSLYNTLYVRSRSNVGSSACVLTNASGTVLTYWNFDGSKIETIDLTQYTGAKWFLYSNFVPYLSEEDMLIQAYLKDGISGYIAKHDSQLNDVDNTPTQNSQKFVKSGGVKSYVDALREDVGAELGKTIAEAIQMTQGALIYTGGTAVGSVVDLTPHTKIGGEYAIVPCQAGDKFIINGNYYGIARCFAFLDADNKMIKVASTFDCEYRIEEAPSNSAKIVINNYNNPSAVSYKADYLFYKKNQTEHDEYKNDISYLKTYHNFGVDIHDFSHFVSAGSSWTISTDNKTATSNGNGYANRLSFDKESFEDASILSAKVIPSSNTFNILIGKTLVDIDGVSTLLGVLKDSNGTYLTVNTIINSSEVSMKHKFDISSLHIGNGFTFYAKLEKSTQNTTLFNVSVTDDLGNNYEVDGLGNGETLADDLLSFGNGEIVGANWGKITIFCELGSAVFSDISFGYPLLMSDLALTIIGHSMVEAGTITPQRNKRFAALLRDSIGADRVCIIGQGGMQTGSDGLSGYIDNILEYVKSSKYIMFCLGRNEPNDNLTCIRYQRINDKVIAKGIKPIWLTVVPARDGDGTPYTLVNNYIKQNFDYIEVDKAFYKADGTIDTSKFVDTVHPNAKGYQAMFNVIKNDKSALWTV